MSVKAHDTAWREPVVNPTPVDFKEGAGDLLKMQLKSQLD